MIKLASFVLLAALCLPGPAAEPILPLQPQSIRFGVLGDTGTGGRAQYQIGRQVERFRETILFDFALLLGDNMYGLERPSDFKKKFEDPYKPLLEAGVKFYASLGNHDNPNQRFYKLFNMEEKRYYSLTKGNVEFFALDSTYMDPNQLEWLTKALQRSSASWKICFFHHPLYSDAARHGSDLELRARLEPVFVRYKVNVVLSGHDHVYERIKPQKGIYYFVVGSCAKLRRGSLKPSAYMAKGFDTDLAFMLVEISGDRFYFHTISRTGATVDSGVIERQAK